MSKTVFILGGTQKASCKNLASKLGLEILFNDGLSAKALRQLEKNVAKSDVIVVMCGAISHHCMWEIKELAKKYSKAIYYHRGFGITGALNLALQN